MHQRRTHTEKIVTLVDVETKDRIERAAEIRDGGNVSRLVRRAINKLIDDEQLDDAATAQPGRAA